MTRWYKDESLYYFLALVVYAIGVPFTFGIMIANGVGPAAIVGCFFWPILAIAQAGYWVAA